MQSTKTIKKHLLPLGYTPKNFSKNYYGLLAAYSVTYLIPYFAIHAKLLFPTLINSKLAPFAARLTEKVFALNVIGLF